MSIVQPAGPHDRPFGRMLAAAFGLVVLAGAATVLMAERTADADRLLVQSLNLSRAAGRYLGALRDAETGQRGYLLTRDPAYLQPFDRAMAATDADYAQLGVLGADDPSQKRSLDLLGGLARAKLEELAITVRLEQTGHHDEALAILRTGHGKALMDQIREILARISAQADSRVRAREAEVAGSRRVLLALVAFSLAGAMVLAGVLAVRSRRALAALAARTAELEVEVRRRRESEDTLRQVQKMESVGQLAGGIAHDFNNLLTVVLGNLETVQRRLAEAGAGRDAGSLESRLSRLVEQALKAGRSAATLTQRLLAFSRRQMLAPTRVDLNRLVADLSDMLRRTLGETVGMETILAGGLWPTLADANQLESALVNLCVNARHAMPGGGLLTIETANAYLDEAYACRFGDIAPGQYVLLSVTDTGTGIAPEVLDRVFEPFFTTKTDGSGSGLGLAMVHGFVKQSGGHVRIYSEVGKGTTVKIYLPRLLEAEAPATPPSTVPSEAQAAEGREVVLVVEDSPEVRRYATEVLQELGYRTLEASNVAEALDTISREDGIDLVFTDVVMPGSSGRDLADALQRIRPELPVLFTTGYSRNAIVHHGRLDADVNLITKPYTQRDLALKVRRALGR